jgi:hypothetical protein
MAELSSNGTDEILAGPHTAHRHLGRMAAVGTLAGICLATLLMGTGCSISRRTTPGRSIGDCTYAVVGEELTHRYTDEATSILSRSFVVLQDDDPRLGSPAVRQKACLVSLEWSRGFWSSSAWVEIKDHEDRTVIFKNHVRGGMMYAGYEGDILKVLSDVATERAAGPPLAPDAETVSIPEEPPTSGVQRSTTNRLMELNDLRARGLITEDEYSEQRSKIIDGL